MRSPESLPPVSQPKRPHTTQEKKELYDASRLETILLEAKKINEGSEGVIATIDLRQLSPELRKFLVSEAELEGTKAIKLLKVFDRAKIEAEYTAQLAAYEALQGHEGVAQVPRPYSWHDLPIKNEEQRNLVAGKLGYGQDDDRLAMLVMDFVDGDDIATFLFKEIIRSGKYGLEKLKDSVDQMSFATLQGVIQRKLNYASPADKPLGEREAHKEMVADENYGLLSKAVEACDVSISKSVRPMLEKSLKILHQKGIIHRDLHHRNVMLGKDGSVYIIDFGKALLNSGEKRDDVSGQSYGKTSLSDDYIISVCLTLELTMEERKKLLTLEEMRKREKHREILESRTFRSAWRDWQERAKKIAPGIQSAEEIASELMGMPGAQDANEEYQRYFFSIGLLELIENNSELAEMYQKHILKLSADRDMWREEKKKPAKKRKMKEPKMSADVAYLCGGARFNMLTKTLEQVMASREEELVVAE